MEPNIDYGSRFGNQYNKIHRRVSMQRVDLYNFNYLLCLLFSLVLCFCGIYLSRSDIDLVDRIASRLLKLF
jgi:hypothetical protein